MADNTALYGKLLAIMQECGYIQKDKKNEFHKYSYASEKIIKEKLHESLVKHRVLFFPSVIEHRERSGAGKDGKETVTAVRVEFRFVDVDTGQFESGSFWGTGSDSLDKGTFKAITGALKYILTSWFLIPTGDDPEGESERRKERIAKKDREAEQYSASMRETTPGDQPPPSERPKPRTVPSGWKINMLENFGKMKREIGAPEYYKILGANGYEKSNEIPDRETGMKIYKEMANRLNDLKLAKADGKTLDAFDREMAGTEA